jgi:hypothetical protein
MIATRYLYAIAAMLAIAMVPTVIHSYVGLSVLDGKTTAAIDHTLDGRLGTDTNRSPEWVRDNFSAEDFIERRYGDVTLFVARSYDLKSLYHHPELGAAYRRSYDSHQIESLPSRSGSIPVHILSGMGGQAAYVLLYNQSFVEEPMWFHARQAIAMLVRPKRQMTLFFAHGPTPAATDSPVIRVLLASLESFQSQTPTTAR